MVSKILMFLIFFFIGGWYWGTWQKLESRFFPVTINTDIYHIDSYEDHTDVWVTFDKVRSCDYVQLSFYDSVGNKIPLIFLEDRGAPPTTRPVGSQSAGPWRLYTNIPIEQLRAEVRHKCVSPWQIINQFWP